MASRNIENEAVEYIVKKYEDRIEYYNMENKLHREDGPAVEYSNGNKSWYINGSLHREDGPAVEYKSGYKEWYINGERHREDGPAIEYSNGTKEWWINGKKTEKDFQVLNIHDMSNKEIIEYLATRYA